MNERTRADAAFEWFEWGFQRFIWAIFGALTFHFFSEDFWSGFFWLLAVTLGVIAAVGRRRLIEKYEDEEVADEAPVDAECTCGSYVVGPQGQKRRYRDPKCPRHGDGSPSTG